MLHLYERSRFGAAASSGGDLVRDHVSLESEMRVRLPIFSVFQQTTPWNQNLASGIAALDPSNVYDYMIALEVNDIPLGNIGRGDLDAYFSAFFRSAAAYPGRVIIRLFHEFNGNWYPWSLASPYPKVTSTQEWRDTWIRIVNIARMSGARNVKFMFCANHADVNGVTVEEYWPGAGHVDLIGLDGYNWGWHDDGSPYHTPAQILQPMYQRLCALHPTAEFMVGEIGSAEHHNKAAWHESLYQQQGFERLTQISFFHKRKERNWRLDSDEATLAVNRAFLRKAPTTL